MGNLNNLKPEGPYGEVCILLKMKNTASNKKAFKPFGKGIQRIVMRAHIYLTLSIKFLHHKLNLNPKINLN